MFKDFLHLIFPQTCVVCNRLLVKGEEVLCIGCMAELPKLNYHKSGFNPLPNRFLGKVLVEDVYAYLNYLKGGRTQKLIHALKYEGKKEVGELFGRWFGQELKESGFAPKVDVVVPVPLHPKKLRQRGYNQVSGFGRSMAESLDAVFQEDILVKSKHTTTQTKKKRLERWQNVEDVYKIRYAEKVEGRKILLVDDVVTTGSTLEACTHVILKANPKSVSIATIAAAD